MVIVLVYLFGLLWLLLFVLALPLIPIYYFALCIGAWFVLPKRGKDVLVVSNGAVATEPWLPQIVSMVEGRALFLNYEERKTWPRWSLSVLLFHAFGPAAKPTSFMPHVIPTVLLIRRFRWPAQFSFGERAVNKEARLEELRSALRSVHD